MMDIISDILITGCVNLENVNDMGVELCGAAIYSSVSAAKYNAGVTLLACIGADTGYSLLEQLRWEFRHLSLNCIFQRKQGVNFYHYINRELNLEEKKFGDYKDFILENISIYTKYLVLSSGTPRLQKSVLRNCKKYEFLAYDSKEIYYETAIEEIVSFIHLVNLFSGTTGEVDRLLSFLQLSNVHELFYHYHNLHYIFYKKGAEGGSLYLRDGRVYSYSADAKGLAVNDCGAGDILLGAFVGLLSKRKSDNVREWLEEAVKVATLSTKFNGYSKLGNSSKLEINVNIELTSWKAKEVN